MNCNHKFTFASDQELLSVSFVNVEVLGSNVSLEHAGVFFVTFSEGDHTDCVVLYTQCQLKYLYTQLFEVGRILEQSAIEMVGNEQNYFHSLGCER